jgi:HlyD family secretion protein
MSSDALPAPARTVPDLGRLRIDRGAAPRARGRNGLLVVLLLATLGFVGWAYATGRLDLSGAAKPPEVMTAVVVAPGGPVVTAGEVTGNGYVIARRRAALSTVLSGRLVELSVEEGSHVKAGQIIARIQHDDYDAALEGAKRDTVVARKKKAELEQSLAASRMDLDRLQADNKVLDDLVTQAASESERAAGDVERNRDLFEKHIIDQGRWDSYQAVAKTAAAALAASKTKVRAGHSAEVAWSGEITRREAVLDTAAAEVARAEEAERQAEIVVDKTFIRAPFDGLVVHKDAEVGEVVAATGAGGNSRGSVATIVDPSTLEVQVELAETRLGTITEGDLTRIALDAAPDKPYRGRVRQVWPTADRQKATVEMRIEFLERPPVLKPEMGARVSFVARNSTKETPKDGTEASPQRPRVDATAIVEAGGKKAVFVVSNGKVRRVDVKAGEQVGGLVEIEAGLVGGETVVVRPPADLVDGSAVRTTKETR